MELNTQDIEALETMLSQRGWQVYMDLIDERKQQIGFQMLSWDIEDVTGLKEIKKLQSVVNAMDLVIGLPNEHIARVSEVEIEG